MLPDFYLHELRNKPLFVCATSKSRLQDSLMSEGVLLLPPHISPQANFSRKLGREWIPQSLSSPQAALDECHLRGWGGFVLSKEYK
eukprot:scaffold265112_cov14-Tisochrysis_lutea.AAC.2